METRRSSLRLPWSQDESPIQPSTRSNATTTTLTRETQIPSQLSNINSISRNSPSTRPKIGQRPPFSPKNRASRNKSQSSSPSQATSKSRLASPSTKSRLSQSPSSSRLTPQSSSPARKTPQVLSTKASCQESVVKTQMQEKNQALQHISSKSTQAQSPILDKKEQMELQTKKLTLSDAVSEAKVSFTDKTMQVSTSNTGESSYKLLKESTSNIHKIKQVVHEAIGKEYGAGEQVQPKQAYLVKQEEATKDQNLVNPGRQTRASPSQNNTISTGSSHKTAASSEPHIPLHKDNISNVLNRVAVGGGNQETAGKTPMNVITLAGDNRGASMQVGSDSTTKGGRIHIHRGYKINPDESVDATTHGEGRKSKDAHDAIEDQTLAAYVNCNVQGINNSISCNSSITERNPGVHMSIPRVPSEPVHPTRLFEAECSVTPARTIKRRCLRGLFLESSDSAPDKPPRHGCRVGCNHKKK